MADPAQPIGDSAAPGYQVTQATEDELRRAVLVEPADLAGELAGDLASAAGQPVLLLDVRWKLGDPAGREHYDERHLPGAVFVDLEADLAAPAGQAAGRHPLPSLEALQNAARDWGLRPGMPVVVYDDNAGQSAARAWWLLRWAGVASVRILDGGLAAWVAAGLPVRSTSAPSTSARPTPEQRQRGDVLLSAGQLPTVDADAAAALAGRGVLLDARAGERYRGEVEPVDSRAGHIPGARSAPTADNVRGDGRFRASSSLRARCAELGIGPGAEVGVYCGSGITAAHEIAALAVIGVPAALYPGSWSQWSADESKPAAVGPDPGVAGISSGTG